MMFGEKMYKIKYNKLLISMLFLSQNYVFSLAHYASSPEPQVVNSTGTIEVAFSPHNGATASIVRAINEAHDVILVEAYSFTSKEIAKALLNAKERGVKVSIILDKSQVGRKYSSATFFNNEGFILKIDSVHAIFHDKVMVIDNKNVITGSFNFTQAAENKNAENVLILRNNPQLAKLYTQDWIYNWSIASSYQEALAKKTNNRYVGVSAMEE